MNKTSFVIMIGGGTLQVPAIKEIAELGLKSIVVDANSNSPGMKIADIALPIDFNDESVLLEKLFQLSKEHHIAGVFTAATDQSFIVAKIAERLELKGMSVEDAFCCTNKLAMRQRLKDKNIPIPLFFLAKNPQEAMESFNQIPSQKAVIKPLDNMGARGVKQIFSAKEAKEAFETTAQWSSTKEVLIEELLEGPELSIDSLIIDKKFYPCGVADRIIVKDPYFIEIGHTLPSQMEESVLQEALKMMHEGALALGITTGVAKGDIKITPQGPRIVEIAARLSGGFMSGYTFPYSSGINLTKAALKLAIGKTPTESELTPTKNAFSVERGILPLQMGSYKEIKNLKKALEIPFIKNIFITAPEGKKITSITNNVDKIGHVIANAPTLKQAVESAEKALKTIEIIMDTL